MRILAIDPGPSESAYVVYGPKDGQIYGWAKIPNDELLSLLRLKLGTFAPELLAIEMVASYGMAVGASVFETCVWTGRFIEAWGQSWTTVYRREVKLHLCDSMKAKDANIRQALIDRYGGKEKAIGKKATPGPLYGVSKDVWSALGIAVTVAERC